MRSEGIRTASPTECRSEYISKPIGLELRYFNIAQLDLSNPKEAHFDQFRWRMTHIKRNTGPRFYSPPGYEYEIYPKYRRHSRKEYLDRLKKIGYEYEL